MTDSNMGSIAIVLAAERDQARAELDEVLTALRGTLNWLASYRGGCAENTYNRVRAILAKHGKGSEDTRGATVPARQGAGSLDGDYSQAPAPASKHGKTEVGAQ